MPHADERGPAENVFGADQHDSDQDDFEEQDFDHRPFDDLDFDDQDDFDRLDVDTIDDLDDLDGLDELDDFDDPEEWAESDAPVLLPPPDEEADERLRQLLERLVAEIPEDTPTVWVRVSAARRGRSVADSPGGDDPAPETFEIDRNLPGLIGYVAPVPCIAVGIVGVGRAHHLEPGQGDAANRQARRASKRSERHAPNPMHVPPGGMSARSVCLMDRSGRMAGRTWLEDGTLIPSPPETGRLVDALRRTFGLPTAAPEFPASELLARLWLANVLAAGEESTTRLGWKQVRELHPSAEALRAVGVPLTGSTLDRAREVAASAWTWSRLRLQAMGGEWLPALIPPELATWMDEGMFSRWVLEGTRSTAELLELVTPWVTPSVLMKLAQAVRT